MSDNPIRKVARLGDVTDHGGIVMQAAIDLSQNGVRVALDGHLTHCPQCKGDFPIVASGPREHHGVKVAYIGDRTACGATLIYTAEGE